MSEQKLSSDDPDCCLVLTTRADSVGYFNPSRTVEWLEETYFSTTRMLFSQAVSYDYGLFRIYLRVLVRENPVRHVLLPGRFLWLRALPDFTACSHL